MTKGTDVHVVGTGVCFGWKVTQGGRTLSHHLTQRTAVKAATRVARRNCVELVTHSRNGRIQSTDSFGDESSARDDER